MLDGPDLLKRVDQILAALLAVRSELAASMPTPVAEGNGVDEADDFAPERLLDTTSAGARFNHPRNTLAKWAREEGIGVRQGGRWLISIPRLQRRLNGS